MPLLSLFFLSLSLLLFCFLVCLDQPFSRLFWKNFFLLVGTVVMHIFVFFFGIAKKLFTDMASSEGGASAFDEFQQMVLSSFDSLPPCFVETMGYVHFIEDLGMIVTCMMLILTVSVFRVMFGAFGVGKITGNSAGLF